jgi:hypothetical protein
MEILDEVHQSKPVNPLEDLLWDPQKYTAFQRALEESSKHSRIVLVDCSLCF